jgi:7,8-dihydropterin-6-yl-methyl-4-(beta-D-ribofuranosyl)aminobenzene 5'-phosphate synthase
VEEAAGHVAGGEAGEDRGSMRAERWLSIGLFVLLAAGCAASDRLPPEGTDAPAPTRPEATVTCTAAGAAQDTPTPTLGEASPGVTVTIVYDNNVGDERVQTAWGFSCLVQGTEQAVLFDTGGDSPTLLSNMRVLGLDPHEVDVVVISHVHGDHIGGLAGFLEENGDVTVYLPQSLPQATKDATSDAGAQVVEVGGPVQICEHVYSTGEMGEAIREQSLIVETSEGLAVITGCAHPGVVSIVRRAKELMGQDVHLVLGGFHLGSASEAEIGAIVDAFVQMGVDQVAPCHCSGDAARSLFGEAYRDDCILAGAGSRLEIPE